MARTGKWPARISLALSAAMIATLFTVINASGQAGAGEGLPTVGIEVQSANNAQVTYAIVVRNQGSAPSSNVRVRSQVPTDTTFESSNPPPVQTTSPSPGSPSCDNAGTREDPGRNCEWSLGTIPAGETRQITAVYNLNQANVATYTVTISANLTDGEGHTNSDSDASLTRARQSIDDDTWVNDDEPPNWNHGQCPNLRVLQNNRVTSYLEANTLPTETDIERLWGALLQAQVQSTSYTQGAPGSIGAHRVTSGEWTEGSSDSAGNQNCPGAASTTTTDARTGAEPQSAPGATGTATINGFPQFASWDVTNDLNDPNERGGASNGWELRDVIGSGDNFTRFHSGEAAADLQPRLFVVYTTQEDATCVDNDPDTDTNPFGTEHIMTAFVTDGTKVTDAQAGDGCSGGPAVHDVDWVIEDDDPDAYFSSQEGQPINKTIQGGNANPNEITTTSDENGFTNVGIRQHTPEEGENRVEARIYEEPGQTDPDPDPDPDGENPPACDIPMNPTNANCTGETDLVDDARKTWNASGASGSQSGTTSSTSSSTGSPSSSSSSGSPSSPSGSQSSGSPSQSGSPSGSASSGSPTGSASSSSPQQSSRTVTLVASNGEVVYPAQVTLSGQVLSSNGSCADEGEFVRIRRRVLGSNEFVDFEAANTGANGRYEIEFRADASAEYIAIAPSHDNCADATSDPATVLVKVKLTAATGRRSVPRGGRVGIVGRVSPDHSGTEVLLQRRKGGRFRTIDRDDLNGRSRYRFVVTANWRGRRVFRVMWRAQDEEHESNRSKNVIIRATRR